MCSIQVGTQRSWQFFFSIYVRASSVGKCSTSTLQQCLFFPILNWCQSRAIPQIRVKKSVTEILLRRSCYGDSVTEIPTHFNSYRFRQTLSTTHRRLIPCKGKVKGSIPRTRHTSGRNDLHRLFLGNSRFCVREGESCLLYTSPSPRDATLSRMPSSA